MVREELKLSGGCVLTKEVYKDLSITDVYLEYVEQSPDPWYSDRTTCVDLNAKTAKEIIEFLQDAFPELKEPTKGDK